jgi:hypothetical protein
MRRQQIIVGAFTIGVMLLIGVSRAFQIAMDSRRDLLTASSPNEASNSPSLKSSKSSTAPGPALPQAIQALTDERKATYDRVAKRFTPEQLHQIFWDWVVAERQATALLTQEILAGKTSGSGQPAHDKYKKPVCKKYKITMAELEAVGHEGDMQDWPRPEKR